MSFKKVAVLFESRGELASTPYTAVAAWDGQADLDETRSALVNSDFWQTCEIKRWKVLDVTLPSGCRSRSTWPTRSAGTTSGARSASRPTGLRAGSGG